MCRDFYGMLYDKQNNTRFLIGLKYNLLKDRRF